MPLIMMPKEIVINPPVFDSVAAYGIGGIAVLTMALCIAIYSSGDRRRATGMTLGFVVLMVVSALAAMTGLLARFDIMPPPMMVMIALVVSLSLAVGLSAFGRSVAMQTSLVALICLQGFRLPLELVMHHAASRGIMPVQLSYSGYNLDILTGLGAIILVILIGFKLKVPRIIVWAWNVWGVLCLLAIMTIAIVTSPVVHAFGDEPENLNTWVLFFPYVWLPMVMVTIAISGHVIITRKLLFGES